MPFEIVSIGVWLWRLFSERCRTAASIRSLAMLGLAGTPKDKNISFQSALKSCFNILSSDMMSNTPSHL